MKDIASLEFYTILDQLSEYAVSDEAKQMALHLEPKSSLEAIRESHKEISEAVAVLAMGGAAPLNRQIGIRNAVAQIEKGYVLSPAVLHESAGFLGDVEKLAQFLIGKAEAAPVLSLYGGSLKPLNELREDIMACISHEMVLDQASPDLAKVRKKIDLVEAKIKDKLDKLLKHPGNKDLLQDQLISQRGGRYVVPVKAAYKKQIGGQVLDRSTSGSTVFIEPEEVKRLHDELNLLRCDEEKICYRIQSELTNDMALELNRIHLQLEIMTHCDWVFARARLARRHECLPPMMVSHPVVKLVEARHPLLEGTAVPLSLELGTNKKGIVITGPNTGGKTVAMKTVGLLTLMALSGLHIPAGKGSVIGNISRILVDIGDGQSISQNLSTFSSHMTNITRILENADDHTLVLLDEIGSGTDPKEGMGIAVAIMESLYAKGCLILASTHYGEIKTFASQHPGFVNGSMGFDVESLRPLYRLTVGKAGDSNGLLIAKRLGLPLNIIERATVIIGEELPQPIVEKLHEDFKLPAEIQEPPIEKDMILEAAREGVSISEMLREKPPEEIVIRDFAVGDLVKIPYMGLSGIVSDLANSKGELEVLIRDKKVRVPKKRVEAYIQRENLYPGEDYDMDIVFKSKDYRKKNKLIDKGKGKGLRIDY